MEHSPVDGHTTLRYAEDFFHYSVRTRCDSERSFSPLDSTDVMAGPDAATLVTKLEFALDKPLLAEIDKATAEFQKFAASVHTSILVPLACLAVPSPPRSLSQALCLVRKTFYGGQSSVP